MKIIALLSIAFLSIFFVSPAWAQTDGDSPLSTYEKEMKFMELTKELLKQAPISYALSEPGKITRVLEKIFLEREALLEDLLNDKGADGRPKASKKKLLWAACVGVIAGWRAQGIDAGKASDCAHHLTGNRR